MSSAALLLAEKGLAKSLPENVTENARVKQVRDRQLGKEVWEYHGVVQLDTLHV